MCFICPENGRRIFFVVVVILVSVVQADHNTRKKRELVERGFINFVLATVHLYFIWISEFPKFHFAIDVSYSAAS